MRYEDLVARPVEALRGIHAGFGLPFPVGLESSARAWLKANPQGRHGVHRYELESYGLDEATVERLFEAPRRMTDRIAEPG